MKIGAITPFSLLDFPGKVSCIVFTAGCNFRCSYCHNPNFVLPELIQKQSLIPEPSFFSFLQQRKWLLEGVSICWWEPTIQKDLYNFCKKVKDLWFLVKLDTNGRDPEILEKLISENLVDYIAMDIKQSFEKWDKIIAIKTDIRPYKKSINILLQGSVDYEFRTTCIKWQHSKEDIRSISQNIKWAKKYFLQNFHSWNTLWKDFDGNSFSEIELDNFKEVSNKYVESCEMRL